jgi:TldD protein
MLVFDDGRLKSAAYDATEGFGLRVVAGEKAGYAHASEVSEAAIRRAASSAAHVAQGYEGVAAEAPRQTNRKLYGEDDPLAFPVFGDKVSLLQEIDAFARARDPRIVQVSASIAGERRLVEILRGDGRLLRDVRPLVRVNVSVTVEKDGRRETGSSGAGGRAIGRARWMRRCVRPWSIWTPSPVRPARWMWCSGRAGTASCCMRRWATAWRATSTARAFPPFPAGSASGSLRPASP